MHSHRNALFTNADCFSFCFKIHYHKALSKSYLWKAKNYVILEYLINSFGKNINLPHYFCSPFFGIEMDMSTKLLWLCLFRKQRFGNTFSDTYYCNSFNFTLIQENALFNPRTSNNQYAIRLTFQLYVVWIYLYDSFLFDHEIVLVV